MRNFKYVRGGKNAKNKPRTRKQAIEMGDVAPVLLENFSTLTGFKPRLDLLEADNHNPPQMSGLPDDKERPDQGDVSGNSDYKGIKSVEKDKVQHEKEHVKQGAVEATAQAETKEPEVSVENQVKQANQEFAEKYSKANTLYDLKKAAGIDVGTSKEDFVVKTANMESIENLDKFILDNEQMYERIKQASASQASGSRQKTASIPTNFSGYRQAKSPFNDDLEMIIAAGE